MNNTLIITTTHGDEQFAVPIIKNLKREYQFDWLTGNPRATKQNVRFTDTDLNRSGPGDLKSKNYEERRAANVIKQTSRYQQTIDIHGTISNTGIFIILSDPNWQNIELAKQFNIQNVVLWPSLKPNGPLTQFIPNSLEIECGPKNNPTTADKLRRILTDFLKQKPRQVKQQYYIVTGSLKKEPKIELKEFSKATLNKNSFYPLMIDQYQNIKCYTMQKITNPLEF